MSLQTRSGGGGGDGNEEIVQMIISDLLAQLPPACSLEDVMKSKADDPSALHVVLFQEIERYNVLINKIRLSCQQLQKGIKGLVVMSSTTSSRPSSTGACRPSGSRRTRH